MNQNANYPGFRLGAVGVGMAWGLVLILAGAVIQGLVSHGTSLSEGMLNALPLVWPAVGALLGGFMAGRRAAATGWLHGALAGAALVLSLAAVMGVASALPTLAWLLKIGGIGTGAGLLGGVLGVNTGRG